MFSLSRLTILAWLLLLPVTLASKSLQPEVQSKVDKVLKRGTYRSILLGFTAGDYIHANFGNHGSEERSFWLKNNGVAYFLVVHIGQPVLVKYETVESFIPEAGSVVKFDRIYDVSIGNITFANWWKDQASKFTIQEIRQKYEPLVEKAFD